MFGFFSPLVPSKREKNISVLLSQFCSACTFFEESVFTFQFLNDKIHNYTPKTCISQNVSDMRGKHLFLDSFLAIEPQCEQGSQLEGKNLPSRPISSSSSLLHPYYSENFKKIPRSRSNPKTPCRNSVGQSPLTCSKKVIQVTIL